MDPITIILGVTTSILAAIVIWLAKNSITAFLNTVFRHVYPNISGEYKMLFLEQNSDAEEDTIVTVKQFTNKLKGSIVQLLDGKQVSQDRFHGTITPTRVVKLSYEAASTEHHDHGLILLRLLPNGKELGGHMVFLCPCCEDSGEEQVRLIKQ